MRKGEGVEVSHYIQRLVSTKLNGTNSSSHTDDITTRGRHGRVFLSATPTRRTVESLNTRSVPVYFWESNILNSVPVSLLKYVYEKKEKPNEHTRTDKSIDFLN
ncbi:hypothetical protein EYF80_034476 [Liparis tanakae]|uniref:Uncharacterized protein n=1 Tax=Liparis tanakae TaxID=230148 RepID=A0A4Z2GP99_9TELE|nr:hypothetical protein EYF80_034476 [Liparis tanakae]